MAVKGSAEEWCKCLDGSYSVSVLALGAAFNIRRYKMCNNYRRTDTSRVDPAHSLAFRNFRPYVSVWHALPRNEMTEQDAGILRIFLLITQLTPHGAAVAGQVHIQHETEQKEKRKTEKKTAEQYQAGSTAAPVIGACVKEPNIHSVPNMSDIHEHKHQLCVHHCALPLRGWPSVPGEYPRVENKVWSWIKVACLFFLPREAEAPLHK